MSAKMSSRCINFDVKGCSNLHLPCIRPAYFLSRAHCKVNRSQRFLQSNSKYGISTAITISRNFLPRASSSPDPSTPPWKKWLLGILLTVILPTVGHKGGLFVGLKAKIDKSIETVEHVTELVEEIADEADKIVEEVEEKLPGDSKLRRTLDKFDNLAKKAVIEAKQAEDIVRKVFYCLLESWFGVFFLLKMSRCGLFNLTGNLQVTHFENYGNVLERDLVVSVYIQEQIHLTHELSKKSHRLRIFILLEFLIVTSCQFVSLLQTT